MQKRDAIRRSFDDRMLDDPMFDERLTDWMPEGISPLTTQEIPINQTQPLIDFMESMTIFAAVFAAVIMLLLALAFGLAIWWGQRDPNRYMKSTRRYATPEEIQRARDIADPDLPPVNFAIVCPECKKTQVRDLVDGVCEQCFMNMEAWNEKHGDDDSCYRE